MARKSKQKHPWRLCPAGEHYRRAHFQSSYRRRDGTPVRGSHHHFSCVINRSGKDQIYQAEIEQIAEKYFDKVQQRPCSARLGFSQGNKYDHLIAGWT